MADYGLDAGLFDEDPDAPFMSQKARANALARRGPLAMPSSGVETPKPDGLGTSEQIFTQIANRMSQRPDEAPLREHARALEEESRQNLLAGVALAMKGGSTLAPFGGHLLQQALKNQGSYDIPGGWGTATSQGVTWNPEKQHEADLARLTTLAGIKERSETARENAALRAAMAGGKSHPLQHLGTTPDGQTVSYDPNTAANVIVGPDGKQVRYSGPLMSQATLDKQAEVSQKALAGVQRMEYLVGRVKSNPRAFGGMSSLAPYIGDYAGPRMLANKLSPQEQTVRGEVLREAGQLVNELYGAALSAGEASRAGGFVPDSKDPPDVVINKLHAGINWAKMKSQEHGAGVLSAAQARQNYGQQPGQQQQTPGRGTADSPIRVTPRAAAAAAPQRDNAIEVPY